MSDSAKRQLHRQRRTDRIAVRRTRLWRLAVVAGLAAVAVGAAVALSSSGGTPPAPAAAAPAAALFAGLPERDGVLGDPDAPVTVTEYIDFQCPVCAQTARDTLPALIRDQVRAGRAKLELRTLHFIGPDSERAARFAAGAERQNRLWPFVAAFYAAQGQENTGYVTDAFLREVAGAAGVNFGAARRDADTEAAQNRLDRANADAQRLGVAATPTFTVARGDGPAQVVAAHDPASIAAAIRAAGRR